MSPFSEVVELGTLVEETKSGFTNANTDPGVGNGGCDSYIGPQY